MGRLGGAGIVLKNSEHSEFLRSICHLRDIIPDILLSLPPDVKGERRVSEEKE